MEGEVVIVPTEIAGGEFVHSSGEVFAGLVFSDGEQTVNVLFRPEVLDQLRQLLTGGGSIKPN